MPSSQSFGVHLLVSCVLADEKRHLGRRRTGPYLFGSLQILNIGHLPHFSRFIISPRRSPTPNYSTTSRTASWPRFWRRTGPPRRSLHRRSWMLTSRPPIWTEFWRRTGPRRPRGGHAGNSNRSIFRADPAPMLPIHWSARPRPGRSAPSSRPRRADWHWAGWSRVWETAMAAGRAREQMATISVLE